MRISMQCIQVLVLAAFMTGLCGMAYAKQGPVNAYDLQIRLKVGGKTVADPSMRVAAGHPAQLTLSNEGHPDGNYRLNVSATPCRLANEGQSAVKVNAVIHEQVAGAWVLLGEPELVLLDGKEGQLTFGGSLGTVTFDVLARGLYDPAAVNFTLQQ